MGFPTYRPIEEQETVDNPDFFVSLVAGVQKITPASGYATAAQVAAKASLASPAFTGIPTAPTAALGTDTDQIATMAALQDAIDDLPDPGSGNVVGPESAVDERIAVFDTTTGKLLKDGGKLVSELQPVDADLTAIAALVSAANKLPYATGSGTWALTDFSAYGRSLVDDADAATARTTLGVVIGTDVQGYDSNTAKLNVAQQFTKPQRAAVTTVASATTMTIDLAANNDFDVTAYAHTGTLANPTNQATQIGQKGSIVITQDGSGGHPLAFASNWKPFGQSTAPSINTTAGVTSVIDYHVISATVIRYTLRAIGA